jgi:hypothetical protein
VRGVEAMPRETWTDERLDDLSLRVESGFDRVDADLRELRSEMNARFDSLGGRANVRFDSLQRTILQVGGGAIATFLIGFAGLIVSHA